VKILIGAQLPPALKALLMQAGHEAWHVTPAPAAFWSRTSA
jgi:hypothetical protein